MFRLKRLVTGDMMLIRVRDGTPVGMIYSPYVEAVSQALGIGIPVRKAEVEE